MISFFSEAAVTKHKCGLSPDVRFGSEAALQDDTSPMSALGRIADVQMLNFVSLILLTWVVLANACFSQ